MEKTCSTMMEPVSNERGFTIIIALILLMLLTIIGVTAINTSTTETMLTSADEDKRSTFYVTESGLEQTSVVLTKLFIEHNLNSQSLARAVGGGIPPPSWTFALDGTGGFPAASPQPTPPPPTTPQWILRYNAGVPIATGTLTNGYVFDARVWNNTDMQPSTSTPAQAAQTDTDGQIVLGVIATAPLTRSSMDPLSGPFTGPPKSRAAVEVVLNGVFGVGGSGYGYTGQAGGGSGKNYNASDYNAISDANLNSLQ